VPERKTENSLNKDEPNAGIMATKKTVTFYVHVPGRKRRKKVSFKAKKWKK